jgi:glyoxylase-like metal-dependent hydrolase (beta-lactamase superfamily II)/carbon monoxide dehydrogenase subunit G
MQFSGTEEIGAPRATVWAFLMDPNQVGSCGPGVQSIEVVDDDHFNARAKVGVGFITATFNVNMTFVERVPLERARISARGQAPGSAVDAVGEMNLKDDGKGGTIMDWSADVNISGTLASVGARLIEGTAHKLIGQTFSCIKTKLHEQVASGEAAALEVAAPEAAVAAAEAPAAAGVEGPAAAEAAPPAAPAPSRVEARPAAAAVAAPRTGALEYLVHVAGPAMTNVYVIADPETREAVAIDTAQPCLDWLTGELESRNWNLKLIITTHGHWDHIGHTAAVQEWSRKADKAGHGAAIAVHGADRTRLTSPLSKLAPFDIAPVVPSVDLTDGDRIVFGSIELEVLHTPGHTDGSVCLMTGSGGVLFSGDTLFAGGWGRVDLPGGSPDKMVESLRRLHGLADQVRVFPGHGRSTAIGRERPWLDVVVEGNKLLA